MLPGSLYSHDIPTTVWGFLFEVPIEAPLVQLPVGQCHCARTASVNLHGTLHLAKFNPDVKGWNHNPEHLKLKASASLLPYVPKTPNRNRSGSRWHFDPWGTAAWSLGPIRKQPLFVCVCPGDIAELLGAALTQNVT